MNVYALTTDWRNTYLVQVALYDSGTTALSRMEQPNVPQLGSVREDATQQQDTDSPIVRTPLTVSDNIAEVDDDDSCAE